jgi:Zn-dependent protease with chaperone function
LSFLASLTAIGIALYSVVATWLTLGQTRAGSADWLQALLASFAPWLILAGGGILASIANRKIEGIFANESTRIPVLNQMTRVGEISGFQIVELPIDYAYIGASASEKLVVQTTGLRDILTPVELAACQRHEAAHLQKHHARIVGAAFFLNRLLGVFAASKAMLTELQLLSELEADNAAGDNTSLMSALEKMNAHPSRETSVRLKFLAPHETVRGKN